MKCPHCENEINDKEIAKYLGSKGGKPRSEQPSKNALKMRKWRKAKKDKAD